MNLYFISGLGADKRIFQKIKLPEPYKIHHIEWEITSFDETIETYAVRLSNQIDKSKPYSFIGLSFGGIIAIELSKKLKPLQTIIISSFCFKKEVSKFYVFMGKTRLYRLIPTRFLLRPNPVLFRLFGAREQDEKDLLTQILVDTDPPFFRWAIHQLFSWDNTWKPESLIHIHGTKDKILPFHESMNAIPVEGGEHLMVFSKAGIVSELLKENLLVSGI